MALLMVSATYDFTNLQTVVVACEEPELYQHPPQARILATALYALASNQTQVIIATHSPYFVTAKSFENVRVIRRTLGQKSQSYQWSVEENCALIARAKGEDPISTKVARAMLNQFLQPQMNEMFFAPGVVLVEGEEDRALISKYFELSGNHRHLLTAGISIVPVSGKGNFINALAIARGFQIPFFAVLDGDMSINDASRENNIKLNRDILAILDHQTEGHEGTITETLWGTNFCVWKDSIQSSFDDMQSWSEAKTSIASEFGWKSERLKKNAMVLEAALDSLYLRCSIPHLDELCARILRNFKVEIAIVTAEPA